MRSTIRCVLTFLFLWGSQARAEMTAREYLQRSQTDPSLRTYLDGISTGIEWYNTSVETRGGKRLFCPPERLKFPQEVQNGLLRRYLRYASPEEWDLPLGLVFLRALTSEFPCQNG
jgi:hypothetical protein